MEATKELIDKTEPNGLDAEIAGTAEKNMLSNLAEKAMPPELAEKAKPTGKGTQPGKVRKSKKPVNHASLRVRRLADGRQSLYIDVYVRGERKYEPLKMYLMPNGGSTVTERKNATTLRKAEKAVARRNRELRGEARKSRRAEEAAAAVPTGPTVTEWMQRFHDMQKAKGVSADSLKRTMGVARTVERFRPGVFLKDIDKAFCTGFMAFLQTPSASPRGTRYSTKTAFDTMGVLSTAMTAAVREGVIAENPYLKLASHEKIKVNESARGYLTIDEVHRLVDTPCRDKAAKQVFLFACCCGLRIGDIGKLTWADLSQDGGRWRLSVVMAKTGRPVWIPLGEQAMRWMPKRGRKKVSSRIFPSLEKTDRTALNKHIGQWAKAAGISKAVTMHVARHTFATMLLTLGADLYTVSKLLGHTSIRHTQRYARIVSKKKDEAVGLIDSMYEKEEMPSDATPAQAANMQ